MQFSFDPQKDDTHTAADDPYQRALAARKWLGIYGGIGLVFGHFGFSADTLNKAAKGALTLGDYALKFALVAAILYALTQYLLIIWQLRLSYASILAVRMNRNSLEKLAEFDATIKAANDQIAHHESLQFALREELDGISPGDRPAQTVDLEIARAKSQRPGLEHEINTLAYKLDALEQSKRRAASAAEMTAKAREEYRS